MRSLPPLPRKVAALTDDLAQIPPGYGFFPLQVVDLQPGGAHSDGMGVFAMYEPPMRGHLYTISADIADGLGKDRTSIDVVRVGTVERPAEQVGHYLSDRIKPREAAFVLDALGHLYVADDGYEAMVVVETNNHGLSTQDLLRLHLGYRHFYLWETSPGAALRGRASPREGWYTTQRTRPMLLDALHEALTTFDPVTGYSDLIVNSPFTLSELHDFQTDGDLADAAAAAGAHDDCVLSLAIANYVSHRRLGGEIEPLAERRRRLRQIEARRDALSRHAGAASDYQNTPYTLEEMEQAERGELDVLDPEMEEALYDIRGTIYDGY